MYCTACEQRVSSARQENEHCLSRYDPEPDHKGQILRVKTGYNPNSSSIGSQVPLFLAFAAGSGLLTILALQLIEQINVHLKNKLEGSSSDSR